MRTEKKVFGTTEWASRNANFISGCVHDCLYCYSKEMAIRFKRKTPKNWSKEVVNQKKLKQNYKKMDGYTMFPSSHDISPENLKSAIFFLDNLLKNENRVLIVTKPHYSVIKELCNRYSDYKQQILFRFTIGSSNTRTLKFWEPGAPSFQERLKSLKYAYDAGYMTSVSCEPILDTNTGALVEQLLPYVSDAVWIGKPNMLLKRLKLNGVKDKDVFKKATQLIDSMNDEWIISLYNNYKKNKKIKWKESIKKIVKIDVPTKKGLDI